VSKPGIILQHGPYGPSGLLGDFLAEHGIAHRTVPVWEEPFGDLSGVPFVVSLGSECSAGGASPAWVPAEVEALRGAVAAGVPVLGLCFGGQALALALGGGVHRLERPEIGWVAVDSDDPEVPAGPWGQYHYELLEVPPGAVEVARSPAGPAAFRAGPHLGVQFHPEVTPAQMEEWLGMDPELPADVDREAAIRDGERCGADAAERARHLFGAWFARLPAPAA
jgi:GMP synthase (glutamine-hydrolysing)